MLTPLISHLSHTVVKGRRERVEGQFCHAIMKITVFWFQQLTDLTSVLRVGFTLGFSAALNETNEYTATQVSPIFGPVRNTADPNWNKQMIIVGSRARVRKRTRSWSGEGESDSAKLEGCLLACTRDEGNPGSAQHLPETRTHSDSTQQVIKVDFTKSIKTFHFQPALADVKLRRRGAIPLRRHFLAQT